MNSNS